MFLPHRYKNFAVYDIRSLIAPKSNLEERIFLEAVRRIPATFQVGDPWGEEKKEGSIWIDEDLYDSCQQNIRMRLRSDVNYLNRLSVSIKKDIDHFSAEVNKNRSTSDYDLEALLNACVTSVSWFATNWLNPFFHVRMAVAGLLGHKDLEKNFDLLIRFNEIPYFIQAYLSLKDMKEERMSDEEYRMHWGAAFNAGDIEGPLSEPGSAKRLAGDIAPSEIEIKRILAAFNDKTRLRNSLVDQLLKRSEEKYGSKSTSLLDAQIRFSSLIVWQEESRHHLQQQTYIIFRKAMKSKDLNTKEILAETVPWATRAPVQFS